MAELTEELIDKIFEGCRSNIADLAQSLGTNLSTEVQLEPGEEAKGSEDILRRVSDQRGIVVTLQFEGFGILCLIPENLPIPDWYRSPDDSQRSQLQILSTEWSAGLLPAELEAVEQKTVTCENLRAHLSASQPAGNVRMLELSATIAGGGNSTAAIHLVMPVASPILEQPVDDSTPADEAAAETDAAGVAPPADAPAAPLVQQPIDPALEKRKQRINKLPVNLIVRIADRKMDVQQLREIAPGTLLMFDKPCDSLLDVFIDNRLYCRGEAVKVGEQFGIKINECNAQVVREKKVHQV